MSDFEIEVWKNAYLGALKDGACTVDAYRVAARHVVTLRNIRAGQNFFDASTTALTHAIALDLAVFALRKIENLP